MLYLILCIKLSVIVGTALEHAIYQRRHSEHT